MKLFLAIILLVAAAAVAFLSDVTLFHDREKVSYGPYVQIGKAKFFVDLARTEAEKQKGLSGKPSLASDHGMLFIYQNAGEHSFWMPDMRFPIDIVWINNGKIVDLDENVSNKFDPANPKFYSPSEPANYVFEIKAGEAKANNIKIGDMVVFENI